MLLSLPEMLEAEEFAEDARRLKQLPEDTLNELRLYLEQVLEGNEPEDQACLWLDRQTMKCRHHEYRPVACRDFDIGSDECMNWREEYQNAKPFGD